MASITTQVPNLAQNTATTTTVSPIVTTPEKTAETIQTKSKQLQPDKVALSEEAKAKSAEAEETEHKNNIDASSLNGVKSTAEVAAENKSSESELDKEIRELSIEILELSVKIQMLQDKEDKESVKELQKLEVDLAIKKGQLEAAIDRKLQLAAVS
ncbi:MAG: hypothetical protein HRT50_01640 [Colwellia sp.]|uniref:hypothetical protein n=1 Tax=Colwellia sp. TaxID=56799 RepID=UPI001D4D75DA|nr:hypothetical protein [Colwellia sp.]NQY47802.1 hypothetical protein [Colwellia sp.]